MRGLLYGKDLFDPIKKEGKKTDSQIEFEWKWMNIKACCIICQYVDASLLHHVINNDNAYYIWSMFKKLFE